MSLRATWPRPRASSWDTAEVSRFADGEVRVEIKRGVRGCKVFLIQSTNPPVNRKIQWNAS